MPDGSEWPKISIVTPSFNQAQYLEETIRSVLLQGYPNLEYFIIDGGSTDGSVEIIKKYEPWLTYWVSEPDSGQSHAINKGFRKSTGEIMAWINSDDYYECDAFSTVAETLRMTTNTLWVAGECKIIDIDGHKRNGMGKPIEQIERWFVSTVVMQPGVFWRRALWNTTKEIDQSLQYSFDYELWMQFVCTQAFPNWIDKHIANFRIHPYSKTSSRQSRFKEEDQIVHNRYSYLVKGFTGKLRVRVLRRNHKANKKLAKLTLKINIANFKIIVNCLWLSPWLLLKRSFYSKVYNKLKEK